MSIEVRNPAISNVEEMKNIWKTCFGDTDEYINYFFDNCFETSIPLVAFDGVKPVSMLFMIPSKLCVKNKEYNGLYIYAVATMPKYRGMGIMRMLEEQAVKIAKIKKYSFLCLVPQSQSLFNMYEKIGYKTAFYLELEEHKISSVIKTDNVKIQECTKDNFLKLRAEYLKNKISFVDFIQPFNDYRFNEFNRAGGNIVHVSLDSEEGYLAGYKKDNTYIIKETSLNKNMIEKVMPFIYNKYKVDSIKIRGLDYQSKHCEPFGMYKWIDESIDEINSKYPYMNMMLD